MFKKFVCLSSLVAFFNCCYGQVANNTAYIERRVNGILSQLTLEEKINMCTGSSLDMGFHEITRLGIPVLQCSDGPRGPNRKGTATAFPSGIAFGATWNPVLIEKAGKVMGLETRAKGMGVLLGPGNNILRDPLNGRFFEYYTEDPYLNSEATVAHIKGIQSEGVAACLKHYACNNREDNRNFYMSMVDERTLHEIYLPAYKAAVQRGHVWTIMTAANGLNNEYVSDSKVMLTDILKDKWGFDGFVMTDWLQTRSTEKAALAGLDVSMPGGDDCGFGKALLDAVREGRVPVTVINDKVKRVLRIYARTGLLDGTQQPNPAQINLKESQKTALDVAEEGIVLLKNKNKLLPLNPANIRNILVIGPNANRKLCVPMAGGSSGIQSPYEITPLAGLKALLGESRVTYLSSDELGGFQLIPEEAIRDSEGNTGFKSSYFIQNKEAPVVARAEPVVDFMWEMKSPSPLIDPKAFSRARFEGTIMPPKDGKYTLRIIAEGIATLYHGFSDKQPIAFADKAQTLHVANASVELKKGEPYQIRIDYQKQAGDAGIRLEWELPDVSDDKWAQVDAAAKKADAVIFIGGIDHSMDTEGRDRKDMNFPGAQENLINRLSRVNKNLITVLINGSPLELGGWLPNVPAVIEAWYPGMEGGTAIAHVLFGKINPSGKLPFSWPKKLSDHPSQLLGSQNNDFVYYTDSLLVGYRYYDTKKIEPEFPFGFGLSYSEFKYDNLKVQRSGTDVIGTVTLTNTGKRTGQETVQIYINPINGKTKRPVHELKFFSKISLAPGEKRIIKFKLGTEAFAHYDVASGNWKIDAATYIIQAGSSSRDIRLKTGIKLNSHSL